MFIEKGTVVKDNPSLVVMDTANYKEDELVRLCWSQNPYECIAMLQAWYVVNGEFLVEDPV